MIAWFRRGLEGVGERGGRVVKGDADFVGGRNSLYEDKQLSQPLRPDIIHPPVPSPTKHASTHLTR